MRLTPINPAPTSPLLCARCTSWTATLADLDGEPFKAYYCPSCAHRLAHCSNAEPGTYGHECEKPSAWVGADSTGYTAGFCDRCRHHGHEARSFKAWTPYRNQ